jgi:hypothetical protein
MPTSVPQGLSGAHLTLFRDFGHQPNIAKLDRQERIQCWDHMCRLMKLPAAPYELVVEAWRDMVNGESDETRVTLANFIDPRIISVGITFRGKIQAAHSLQMKYLLRKILVLHMANFPDGGTFLHEMRNLCIKVASEANKIGTPK